MQKIQNFSVVEKLKFVISCFIKKNELWFGSWGGGFGKLNTITGKFSIYKYEELNPINGYRNNVKELAIKSENELWFAAEHKALGIINTISGETQFISSIDGKSHAVPHPSEIVFFN